MKQTLTLAAAIVANRNREQAYRVLRWLRLSHYSRVGSGQCCLADRLATIILNRLKGRLSRQ